MVQLASIAPEFGDPGSIPCGGMTFYSIIHIRAHENNMFVLIGSFSGSLQNLYNKKTRARRKVVKPLKIQAVPEEGNQGALSNTA